MIHLNGQKKVLLFAILVFLFSFLWQMFLTYGIGFFWESIDIFHLYWKDSKVLSDLSDKYNVSFPTILPLRLSIGLSIAKEFVKKYFVVDRLFQIGFFGYSVVDRPYQFFMWALMRLCFGSQVMWYNMLSALIFAVTNTILFCVICRLSILFALLATGIFATSSEIWLASIYKGQPGVFSICCTFIAVLTFIKLTERKKINYLSACLYYFLIITASNFATLTIGDGRYLPIIFLLTLLIFQRDKLRFHLPMLIIIFMMEIPILGFIKKSLFDHSFAPIDLSTHIGTLLSTPQSLKKALLNYKFARNAVGSFLLVILYIALALNIAYLFLRKNSTIFKQRLFPGNGTKIRIFVFVLWFISALAMVARARGFAYDGSFSFQLYDLIYFILPFILFLFYYFLSIRDSLQKPYRIIVLVVFFYLIVVQILHNGVRLNRFRGAWGNHFCAWQNAEKYIDKHSNNALALAYNTDMHYRPFSFNKSDNKLLFSQSSCEKTDFCDLNYIESKFKEGYKDIFVFGKSKPQFRGISKNVILHQQEFIDGDSGDLYDRFKRFIGHPSEPVMYLYHFKLKKD